MKSKTCLMLIFVTAITMIASGCDSGTYEERLNQPADTQAPDTEAANN